MTARIYLPARSAMQSGHGKKQWILDYEPETPTQIEPLMGWTSSENTRTQIRLRFDTKEQAIAYAERNNLTYRVEEPRFAKVRPVSYSDNFGYNRLVPWSH